MKRTKTSYKLLELLSDGDFHSGEALGQSLGITRSAIWKATQQLDQYGITLESIPGRGYRIPHNIDLLKEQVIQKELDNTAQNSLSNLIVLDEIASTNDYLLELQAKNKDKNIACFAEYQTKGRGRRGRRWVAPFGTNIYHSLLWHFKKDPAEIVGLSLIIAIATVNALKHYGLKDGITLKWPNDIYWNGRKLGGVLLDMIAEHHGYCSVVIGVGINTYIPDKHAKQIDQPWVDIQHITNLPPRRNQIAGLLLNEIIHAILTFEEKGLEPFIKAWRNLDNMIGKNVSLHTSSGEIKGIMDDVSNKGELVLLCENNEKKRFFSGEVRLRLDKGK